MSTYVVFLRSINVAPRFVKMEALRGHLETAGLGDVETYIQSGNVRLTSRARSTEKVTATVEDVLQAALGFEVKAVVRTPADLSAAVASAPASPLRTDARHYLVLLRDAPSAAAAEKLAAWEVEGERLELTGRDVHLWITKPYNEAKASNARVEKLTGVAATTRDWKVVTALAEKWR